MKKRILSLLLCIVLCLTLLPLGQVVYAEEVTKTGGPSTYFDSLTIGGQVISDCTEEMAGTGWKVKASGIFLYG